MDVLLSNYVFLISSVGLLLVTGEDSLQNSTEIHKEVQDEFDKLLNSIADINEKRLNALKKYTELEWDSPSDGLIRDIQHDNNDHFDQILRINQDRTKKIIEKALQDMLCKQGSGDVSIANKKELQVKNSARTNLRTYVGAIDDKDIKNKNSKLGLFNSKKGHKKEALRGSCWKEAYKSCKKTCDAALSHVCDIYMCSKYMKKDFKKQCEYNCKYRLGD